MTINYKADRIITIPILFTEICYQIILSCETTDLSKYLIIVA